MRLIAAVFANMRDQIREVNRRYAQPRIHMTPFVKVCLFGLRAYLFTLVGLMLFKFMTLVK